MLEMRASFWCLFGGMFVDKKGHPKLYQENAKNAGDPRSITSIMVL